MKITNTIRNYTLASIMAITPVMCSRAYALCTAPLADTFEHTVSPAITPQGTDDVNALKSAPSCDITIAGEKHKAGIVVNLRDNILYTYDSEGNPTKAYLVASGKKSTPTPEGIFVVTHKEVYPYRSAPKSTKRYKNPRDYGKYIVCLNRVNKETGERKSTGYFVHGCRSYHNTFEVYPSRRVSHGCVRMEEHAISEVKEVQPGTYVWFTYLY